MKLENIQILQCQSDSLDQQISREDVELWFARDIQEPASYAWWENFQIAIERVLESCETTGYDKNNYFYGITKMVRLGRGLNHAIQNERVN